MDQWELVKTAYAVASRGTISAAAQDLDVHRATVLRHVNALEEMLGEAIFLRHAKGYTPTEAGMDLMRVARVTDEQITELFTRIRGQARQVTGELTITTIGGISPMLMPAITTYRRAHQGARVSYVTTARMLRLEYGEADVAIRAGARHDDEEHVSLDLAPFCVRLCASQAYLERAGHPRDLDALDGHAFVRRVRGARAPFERWLDDVVPAEAYVLECNDTGALHHGIASGMGIGFMSPYMLDHARDVVDIFPGVHVEAWSMPLWMLSHRDQYHTYKVRAFVEALGEHGLLGTS